MWPAPKKIKNLKPRLPNVFFVEYFCPCLGLGSAKARRVWWNWLLLPSPESHIFYWCFEVRTLFKINPEDLLLGHWRSWNWTSCRIGDPANGWLRWPSGVFQKHSSREKMIKIVHGRHDFWTKCWHLMVRAWLNNTGMVCQVLRVLVKFRDFWQHWLAHESWLWYVLPSGSYEDSIFDDRCLE